MAPHRIQTALSPDLKRRSPIIYSYSYILFEILDPLMSSNPLQSENDLDQKSGSQLPRTIDSLMLLMPLSHHSDYTVRKTVHFTFMTTLAYSIIVSYQPATTIRDKHVCLFYTKILLVQHVHDKITQPPKFFNIFRFRKMKLLELGRTGF